MSKKTKDSEKKVSNTSPINKAVLNGLSFLFYILIGILLCYLKIVFGDLCRDEKMGYDKFLNTDKDGDNKFVVNTTGYNTTPSLFYYNNQDKKYYCKQLYVTDPNFIKTSTISYSKSGKDEVLKLLFLETAYSIFGAINVLEDIPDWIIILLGPIIFIFIYIFSILFLWIIMSYHIFNYFTDKTKLFENKLIGGIVGFIFWIFIMCFFGFTVTTVTFFYGLFRIFSIIFSSSKELVKVHFENKDNKHNDSYSFGKYVLDMNGTSNAIHLLFIYGGYVVLGNFNKQIAYTFVIIALMLLFLMRNQLHFVTIERLLNDGWTTNLKHIDLSPISNNIVVSKPQPV
jgi:hypothetical protein